MNTRALKIKLVQLISDCIDEESIPEVNSFVEMDRGVIHYAGDGGDRYLKVTLTEVAESEYLNNYNPDVG